MEGSYIFNLVATWKLLTFYIIVVFTFIYVLILFRKDYVSVLIILCFYSGLAAYLGKTIENPYKIVLVILTIYLSVRNKSFNYISKRNRFVIITYILFTISFFMSALLNRTYFNLTVSQYGKYVTPFCLFFIFSNYEQYFPRKIEKMNHLLFILLSIQVILSICKYLIMGFQESIVGSVSYVGGGAATTMPILGFMLLWLNRGGIFKRKEWIYILLLLIIGIVSVKRAVWFIMPIVVSLFMFYISGKKIRSAIVVGIPFIPLIFYLGVRLNPTLNKENLVWGSFDLNFVLNYANEYTFGKDANYDGGRKLGEGRGGATLLLFSKFTNTENLTENDFYGFGLDKIYTTDYEEFDKEKFGVNHKGSVTGVFQSYISAGFIGVFTTFLYILSILLCIKERKLRYVLAGFIIWDYFFYSGFIMRSQALSILFFYFVIYSNYQQKKGIFLKYKKNSLIRPPIAKYLNNPIPD